MHIKQAFKATVVGAGPAGVAAMGRLLSAKIFPILWIDPVFDGGKLVDYQKVPANTKTKFFQKFMEECPAYADFLKDKNSQLNPNEIFKDKDPEKPCILDSAYYMCKTLTRNIELNYFNETKIIKSEVEKLILLKNKIWEISTKSNEKFLSENVILAIGCHPKKFQLSLPKNNNMNNDSNEYINNDRNLSNLNNNLIKDINSFPQISLDALVNDDEVNLSKYVSENDIIGVIGSSHSSILALKHLEGMKNPPKKIHCFYREKIRYAVHTDKGIIYDNIGLKGQAAMWAKEHLEAGKSRLIEMHWMKDAKSEKEVYEKYLSECTKIAPTIGFQRNYMPKIFIENKNLDLKTNKSDNLNKSDINLKYSEREYEELEKIDYDGVSLKLNKGNIEEPIENLWGIGIAFPRHVRDLSGIMGMDVGVYKFGNAAKILIDQISLGPKF